MYLNVNIFIIIPFKYMLYYPEIHNGSIYRSQDLRELSTSRNMVIILPYWSAQSQIAKFMGPTWDPPGFCRPQMGPMLAPCTLLSGVLLCHFVDFYKWSHHMTWNAKDKSVAVNLISYWPCSKQGAPMWNSLAMATQKWFKKLLDSNSSQTQSDVGIYDIGPILKIDSNLWIHLTHITTTHTQKWKKWHQKMIFLFSN